MAIIIRFLIIERIKVRIFYIKIDMNLKKIIFTAVKITFFQLFQMNRIVGQNPYQFIFEKILIVYHFLNAPMNGKIPSQKEIKQEDVIALFPNQNIVHSIRHIDDLDEAIYARKDIKEVLDNLGDFIDILVESQPLAILKMSIKGEQSDCSLLSWITYDKKRWLVLSIVARFICF